MNRLNKIKNHLKNNKRTYIVGAGTFVLGIVTTMWLVQRGNLYLKATGDNNVINAINNPETVNMITNYIENRGRPGNPVQCVQTKEVWKSQELAASSNGSSAVAMSRHLNGMYDDLKGLTYTRLVPEV